MGQFEQRLGAKECVIGSITGAKGGFSDSQIDAGMGRFRFGQGQRSRRRTIFSIFRAALNGIALGFDGDMAVVADADYQARRKNGRENRHHGTKCQGAGSLKETIPACVSHSVQLYGPFLTKSNQHED